MATLNDKPMAGHEWGARHCPAGVPHAAGDSTLESTAGAKSARAMEENVSVQSVEAFSPYTTATATFAALPTWMNQYDAERINAYQVYEQIYWNVPETFKLTQRGSDAAPIYVPTARTLVDTTQRYLCPKPGFIMDPDVGTPDEQQQMRLMLSNFFKRENFWSKYTANKRYGILRGDWAWHILANPAKPVGSRLKIEPLDPAAYFPISHPDDPDRIIAAYIVEQFATEDGTVIKRQTYQKGIDPIGNDGSDTTIYNSIALFEIDAWEELGDKAITVLRPPTALPPQITAIPIYHIRNIETPGDPFGSSELRGFERMLAAINQALSDEEMVLALEGLGMYATDGGPPRDGSGTITDWQLGPGMVVEHTPGSKFARVSGVTSVAPMQDHLKFMINSLREAASTPDIATGKVDVAVAESGISLRMQLGPMLSKVDERGEVVIGKHMQMYHDICQMWMPAYEQLDLVTSAVPVFGDPIPENRDAKFKEIMALFTAAVVDVVWVHEELAKIGYDFPIDMANRVLNERQAMARATDPFASRLDNEAMEGEV
jgi:hypothetical protein